MLKIALLLTKNPTADQHKMAAKFEYHLKFGNEVITYFVLHGNDSNTSKKHLSMSITFEWFLFVKKKSKTIWGG